MWIPKLAEIGNLSMKDILGRGVFFGGRSENLSGGNFGKGKKKQGEEGSLGGGLLVKERELQFSLETRLVTLCTLAMRACCQVCYFYFMHVIFL